MRVRIKSKAVVVSDATLCCKYVFSQSVTSQTLGKTMFVLTTQLQFLSFCFLIAFHALLQYTLQTPTTQQCKSNIYKFLETLLKDKNL